MTADTTPGAAPPEVATPRKVYERKTRVPDWLTDFVLVITGVFGIWAVALVLLTFIGIISPGLFYSDQKSAIKAAGATVVLLLVFSQFYTMESVLGHLPRGSIKMRSMMRVHRWGGQRLLPEQPVGDCRQHRRDLGARRVCRWRAGRNRSGARRRDLWPRRAGRR